MGFRVSGLGGFGFEGSGTFRVFVAFRVSGGLRRAT